MNTINDQTRLQFTSYLRHTLIPDFRAADMDATAEDYETALQFICADVEAMHDARKALLAASAHTPAGSNAAALVAASIAELDQVLGYPAKAQTPATHDAPARRCLDMRSNLHD